MRIHRGAIAVGSLVALLHVVSPANAEPALRGRAHGVVDFGDAVEFAVDGAACESTVVRVRAVVADAVVEGPAALIGSGTGSGSCAGIARVPTFDEMRAAGWEQGESIELALVAGDQSMPLRYQRIEVDQAETAAGSPQVVVGTDPDTGPGDSVLAMATGDAVDLGRVDVEGIDSIALRMCIVGTPELADLAPLSTRIDAPVRISVLQDSPGGPALVHGVDASSNPTTWPRVQTLGFGGTCWRLGTFPVTGRAAESAPRLFLKVDLALPGTFSVNSIDFNGTGARSPSAPNWVTPDPPGMQTIFDGTSFDGWRQTGCALRDGAATNLRTGDRTAFADCSMTHRARSTNRVIRLEVRRENFFDNGGIYVPAEIQLRSVGEYLPGGYFEEYAARWQKLNAWPAWSQVEIIQLGARYVVRLNGRTVTDHVAAGGAPRAYPIQLVTQPIFSYRFGVSNGFGYELHPDLTTPDEWGAFWFRNVRVYECASADDPVCTALAAINDGQAPKEVRR